MKVLWPFGTASRGVVSNHHMLRRLNTVRGERCGKGALEVSGGDQEGERKRIADDVSLYGKVASEPGRILSPGMSLAGPGCWPGGVRHGGDASLVCGLRTERGKACPDTPAPARGGERECPDGCSRKGSSTEAGCAGGPARSSGEAPVTGVERRGRVICGWFFRSTGDCSGRSLMSELKSADKPFRQRRS